MNRLVDNPEVKSTLLMQCVISAVGVALTALLDFRCGLLTLSVCIALVSLHIVSVRKRYRRFAELSLDIDKILHGNNHIHLEKYSEGELAVLQNELHKMISCLQQQKEQLKTDKIYLADSIADISHQIRTPITSINILTAMIADNDITDEKRTEITNRLFDMLSRIDWLITSLLKISKLDTGTVNFRKESIPLERLIKRSCNTLVIPIEIREQNLVINAVGDFTGDIEWTSEAISNIVKNCTEHTQTGGTISINAIENPLYTEIVISDNGKGISEEDLPHIFERFYKGKDSDNKGFGIGLALARMIVSSQNGTLKAESRNGAIFTIRFYKVAV